MSARRSRWLGAGSMAIGLAAAACGSFDRNVTTQHNDNGRTGAYLAESILTPAAVESRGMRVRYYVPPCRGPVLAPHPEGRAEGCLDGAILTQPLYVDQVTFDRPWYRGGEEVGPGVFVATSTNKVYALNADTGERMWETDLLEGLRGILPRGVTATPVIDLARNRLFVVFSGKNQDRDLPSCVERDSSNPVERQKALATAASLMVDYWLAALDLSNGDIVGRSLIAAGYKRRDGSTVRFVPEHQVNHPALLLHQGSIYVAFGSPAWSEGCVEYHGWVMRYSAADLRQQAVFNTSPEWTATGKGSGVWQGGGGLAADANGVFFLTGDGVADTSLEFIGADRSAFQRRRRLYGDSILRLKPTSNSFQVASYTPPGADELVAKDADLGSGGALLIPDSDVVIGGGKSGLMYLLAKSTMAELQVFNATTNMYDSTRRGDTWNLGPHLHGSPTYWAGPDAAFGFLYVWGEKDILRQYRFEKGTQRIVKTPVATGPVRGLPFIMPGGMLSLSADGTRRGTGVLWGTLPMGSRPDPHPGGLYAFDAETLKFLWNTRYGTIAHWVPPTIAGGKVFLAEGSMFKPGSEMLTAYELGREGGQDSSHGRVNTPDVEQGCKSCHTANLQAILEGPSMSANHATGGAARMQPGLNLQALAPPRGFERFLVLQGQGTRTYEARQDPAAPRGLTWVLQDGAAELEGRMAAPADASRVRVSVASKGPTTAVWTAADGSVVAGEIDLSVAAPEAFDAEWVRYRVTREAQGVFRGVTFVQLVYTHAGRAPKTLPKRAGEIVRVPYVAEYWMYR